MEKGNKKKFVEMWNGGSTNEEIRDYFNIGNSTIYSLISEYKLKTKKDKHHPRNIKLRKNIWRLCNCGYDTQSISYILLFKHKYVCSKSDVDNIIEENNYIPPPPTKKFKPNHYSKTGRITVIDIKIYNKIMEMRKEKVMVRDVMSILRLNSMSYYKILRTFGKQR